MPSSKIREKIVKSARKIVIKIGTQVLTDENGHLDINLIRSIANQAYKLIEAGKNIVIVSSGAIGAGMGILQIKSRPKELSYLQASAAVGQGALIQLFERAFAKHNLHAGQILVTRADFEDRRRYLNIERTISALHKLSSVPVINENDTVAVDEIRFGDNDLIATLVANLFHADLLIMLTAVEGLLDKQGNLIDFVKHIDKQTESLLKSEKSTLGVGGMQSKLQAIKLATQSGIDTIIASGKRKNVIIDLLIKGEKIGTVFGRGEKKLAGKRRWIASAARAEGTIIIDNGAARAIIAGGKSLLPGGVIEVKGKFDKGQVVLITNSAGEELARGVTNYSSEQIALIKGKRTDFVRKQLGESAPEEIIHRDNLITTAG